MLKLRGTNQYKDALADYNVLKQKIEDIKTEQSVLQNNLDDIEKEKLRLREEEIRKGEMAAVAAVGTLAIATSLDSDYNNEINTHKRNQKKIEEIRMKNAETIKLLAEHKKAIGLALEAKRDAISDYVNKNHLERYDTERDPYYKELVSEYRSLKNSYRQVDISLAKLEESNKTVLAEKHNNLGEIGKNIIENTENNKNENIKEANENLNTVLIPFKKWSWEKQPLEQKKENLENLLNWNTQLLEIENKPIILYYRDSERPVFGSYSPKHNVVWINEAYIDDPYEVVNTVSHECRHCYQYERAKKNESNFDFACAEGIENYIHSNLNYKKYQNQFIEQDADMYGAFVSNRLKDLDDEKGTNEAQQIVQISDVKKQLFENKFRQKNRKEGRFDTSINSVAFERTRDASDKDKTELLEVNEKQSLRQIVTEYYENGKFTARFNVKLKYFKEHFALFFSDGSKGHIEKTYEQTEKAGQILSGIFSKDGLGFSSNIDRKALGIAAYYHDTGMDHNIIAKSPEEFANYCKKFKEENAENEKLKEAFIKQFIDKKIEQIHYKNNKDEYVTKEWINSFRNNNAEIVEKYREEALATYKGETKDKFLEDQFKENIRKEHSLQSAIHVLKDKEKIIEKINKDVDVNKVALLCFVHSKSCSGINNFANDAQWKNAITILETEADKNGIITDFSFIRDKNGNIDQVKLAELKSAAAALRLGDACAHDCHSKTAQNGNSLEANIYTWEMPSDNNYKNYLKEADPSGLKAELRSAHVLYFDKNNHENLITDYEDPSGMARMYAVGEGNFKKINLANKDDNLCLNISLVQGNAFPLSTQKCIDERISEIKCLKIKDGKDEKVVPTTITINLGSNVDKDVIESYEFYKKMRSKNGINVQVIYDTKDNDITRDIAGRISGQSKETLAHERGEETKELQQNTDTDKRRIEYFEDIRNKINERIERTNYLLNIHPQGVAALVNKEIIPKEIKEEVIEKFNEIKEIKETIINNMRDTLNHITDGWALSRKNYESVKYYIKNYVDNKKEHFKDFGEQLTTLCKVDDYCKIENLKRVIPLDKIIALRTTFIDKLNEPNIQNANDKSTGDILANAFGFGQIRDIYLNINKIRTVREVKEWIIETKDYGKESKLTIYSYTNSSGENVIQSKLEGTNVESDIEKRVEKSEKIVDGGKNLMNNTAEWILKTKDYEKESKLAIRLKTGSNGECEIAGTEDYSVNQDIKTIEVIGKKIKNSANGINRWADEEFKDCDRPEKIAAGGLTTLASSIAYAASPVVGIPVTIGLNLWVSSL